MLNKETIKNVADGVVEVAKATAVCAVIGLCVCRTYKIVRDTVNYLEEKKVI